MGSIELAVATAEPTRTSGAVVSKTTPHVCAPIDANGNLADNGDLAFTWDADNRIRSVTSGAFEWMWKYNGDDERVELQVEESGVMVTETHFMWCGHDLCEERQASGAVLRTIVLHGESLTGGHAFVTADHLGSARDVTALGTLVQRNSYDPFGNVVMTGTVTVSAGFAEQRTLAGAPVSLTKHRAYSSTFGRWLSEDPIRLGDGPNLYGYVWNNPTQWIDPTGTVRMRAMLPTNGNLWPGNRPQDGVCSSPASGLNSNTCARRCCEDHDRCYEGNRCNSSSWLRFWSNKACNSCNFVAAGCIVVARALPRKCLEYECRADQ